MSIIEKAIKKRSDQVAPPVPVQSAPAPSSPAEPAGHSKNHINIPLTRLGNLGMLTPSAPNSPIAEEYRAIKRPLLMNIAGEGAAKLEHANLIMVASALSEEGKTFSAVNLALSIAMEQGKSVLFIDADVAKASAGELLGVPRGKKGLIDLLEDQRVQFADVVLQTNVPNLRVIPAGTLHQRSTELLASDDMHRLMAELSRRYADRVIIFDSPPLLLTTEARVLSSFMGQIVFVVAAEQTSQEAVQEALQYISSDCAVGMLLNKAQHQSVSKYTYGYGYGYGARRSAT